MPRLSLIFASILLLLFTGISTAKAQGIGDWEATTSYFTTNEIVQDRDGTYWIFTDGGMYSWSPDGPIDTFTPLDGMYRLRPTAAAYDADAHKLWLGFNDGMIQSLDLQRFTWRRYNDIRRNQSFDNRAVNRMRFKDGDLYIATQFGIVVFDTGRGLVDDSYVNLGRFSRGTPVLDFIVEDGIFYAATSSGLAVGDRASGSLAVPLNWDNSDGSGEFGTMQERLETITFFEGLIYASSSDNNFIYGPSGWETTNLFPAIVERFRLSTSGGHLLAISESGITILDAEGNSTLQQVPDEIILSGFYNDGNQPLLLAGTLEAGTAVKSELNQDFDFVRPSGPNLNFFTGLSTRDGSVISASSSVPGQRLSDFSNTNYYILENGEWVNFNRNTNDVLRQFDMRSIYRSLITDTHYYLGSFGRGLVKHDRETNEITIFNANNSPLQPSSSGGSFVVIGGIDEDTDGNVWVATRRSVNSSLHKYNPSDESWETYTVPSYAGTNRFMSLTVDRFSQQWIPLEGSSSDSGVGMLVNRVEEDGTQTGVRLTTSQTQGNLPSELVNAVVEDKRGEIWIGTGRGVARFLFPDRVIDGSVQDRQATLLINADPDADSPFLLRDIHATSIAVNAANQKWVGSRGDGLWLVDEAGRNILKHFSVDNSPIFSNTILDVAVDDATGTVYIATDEGLMTYIDTPKTAERSMNDLFVYPNPYNYNRNTGNVVIEGLTDETLISIITVDGRTVQRLNARSGRAEWDVRDFNGNQVSSGIYIIVANDSNGDERGVGKIAIIR